jgi:hypothetical protein
MCDPWQTLARETGRLRDQIKAGTKAADHQGTVKKESRAAGVSKPPNPSPTIRHGLIVQGYLLLSRRQLGT